MGKMNKKKSPAETPQAIWENIVTQELGDELLIYDLSSHKAMNLNEPVAYIWNLCDGKRTISEIKESASRKLNTPLHDEYIFLTLNELNRHNLLVKNDSFDAGSGYLIGNLSRREAIRKIGLTTVVALPIITALVAPTAADAQSATSKKALGATCATDAECASDCCQAICTPSADCFI
jgi:hypothetical protein